MTPPVPNQGPRLTDYLDPDNVQNFHRLDEEVRQQLAAAFQPQVDRITILGNTVRHQKQLQAEAMQAVRAGSAAFYVPPQSKLPSNFHIVYPNAAGEQVSYLTAGYQNGPDNNAERAEIAKAIAAGRYASSDEIDNYAQELTQGRQTLNAALRSRLAPAMAPPAPPVPRHDQQATPGESLPQTQQTRVAQMQARQFDPTTLQPQSAPAGRSSTAGTGNGGPQQARRAR